MKLKETIEQICELIAVNGMVWVNQIGNAKGGLFNESDYTKLKDERIDWRGLWSFLTGSTAGGLTQSWIPGVIQAIIKSAESPIPEINFIPAKRIVGETGEDLNDLSGRGLIDHLASLQNPSWDKQESRLIFERINRFLQDVTGKPNAFLEIPSGREHILVHMDNKVLPLSSLGTGIHEVVLIAAFCTIHDGGIMCLEEPEIHLHPVLQKKLISPV